MLLANQSHQLRGPGIQFSLLEISRLNKMKLFAVAFFFISFTCLLNDAAATSELPYGGGFLTPCGKYIPGKLG